MFPAPAVSARATDERRRTDSNTKESVVITSGNSTQDVKARPLPGTLPDGASELSAAARGLLLRLLERDPKVRMRNLRQLQQSAFYMGFNFEHVKVKKVSPKSVLEKHFPNGPPDASIELYASRAFATFDQPTQSV